MEEYLNINGNISQQNIDFYKKNRAFNYADALFETLKIHKGKICFFEEHYFRLMAGMRQFRMEIPMNFTLEFLEQEIKKLLKFYDDFENGKIRLTVFRNATGLYLPDYQEVGYVITAQKGVFIPSEYYKVDLFKDYLVPLCPLSNLKSTGRILNVLASIFANENELDQSLLLNQEKRLAEAGNGNIFLIKENKIKTPSLSEGCINGIARKKIIERLKKENHLHIKETTISPFELQTSDEIFTTNAIVGVQWITNYRKKKYDTKISQYIYKKWRQMCEECP